MTMKMVRASLETRNFSFDAYGKTDEQARSTLIQGLEWHAIKYQIPLDWWQDVATDIQYRELQIGKAYRDGMML